jgi:tight adherence protein C
LNASTKIALGLLLLGGCVGLITWIALAGRKTRLDARIDELSGRGGSVPERKTASRLTRSLPKFGTLIEPAAGEERSLLKTRLVQAGFYSQPAMQVFLGVKVVLMTAPAAVGLILGLIGVFPLNIAVLAGACLGIVGMIGPSLWLDRVKSSRGQVLRRALPDALDLLVICLEGGLTLQSAVQRIAEELRTAHPVLAGELLIVQREVQLGLHDSEAIKHMADRTDLSELRSMVAVITQSERFGASLVKGLKIHSESLRQQRKQHAEEMAQKAGTKILFPTLLFIFPAIFVVILGPAFFQIMRALSGLLG